MDIVGGAGVGAIEVAAMERLSYKPVGM